MSELEEKLGSILSNPQMMQQIMGLASALSAGSPASGQTQATPPQAPQAQKKEPQLPLAALAGNSGVDDHQKALLSALGPYLHKDRLARLERAMHAAAMAGAASAFLNAGGLQKLTGR